MPAYRHWSVLAGLSGSVECGYDRRRSNLYSLKGILWPMVPVTDNTKPLEDNSPDALVARARALVPGLRKRQRETERAGKVMSQAIESFHAAGLYKVLQPRHFGGYEHGLDTFMRVAIEIASGCGSTGWVFSTGLQHQWQIGMYAREAQEEVWKFNPTALAASSYAPTGIAVAEEGGYRASGKWSFCSGVDICQWMILGVRIAPAKGADPTEVGFILVPKDDYHVKNNWDVLGLIATGSNDVVLEDVFVPAHRMLTHEQAQSGKPPGAKINDGNLFKIPFFAAISNCLCAAILGMAQGALENYLADVRGRQTRGAAVGVSKSIADFMSIQLRVGEAAASIDAAQQLVLRDCCEIMDTIAAGRELTEAQRARNKGDLGFAVKLCVRAADLLFESVGGVGLYGQNRVQRSWRDIHSAAKHISMNWDAVGSLYGRIQLGLPAGPAQF
ncbi:acyl-CoA dehydrogenase family protein [Alphaproteobacteria bacterium]|nr:acyl-CoA dehydrogenase family protein [Alphaproteobacteria bacterium]